MAEGVSVLQTRMRENLFIGDNGVDSIETASQGSRDETIEKDSGYVEDRFRVDRKKLEQMLQLVPLLGDEADEGAEDFFQRVMDETNTQITWPSKLKIGAKSKKDPHIKVIGFPENVTAAKNKIMTVLDTKSNRVTLKMDVSHTEHSHVIGKGGNNIKRVMSETGCHIHFPDSNRGNSSMEKSNQVSIAGQPEGVEIARKQIRELLPLVFMFELPVTSPVTPVPDITSPSIQHLQQVHSVTINFKQRPRSFATTAIIRGSVHSAKGVQQATARLMEQLTGSISLPVSMQLEIAPQHHLFIIGRGGVNIKHIMQRTGANVLFPDPNTSAPQRKGTVYITGSIDSVFLARQHLIGCLPLVLMFDVKESIELEQGRVTQLMEHLDVYISVKPKPKQPSKSVIVKSIERNAGNMYLARQILLGLKSDIKITALNSAQLKRDAGLVNSAPLSLATLGVIGPSVLSVNTANYMISGQPTPSHINGTHFTNSPISPSHWVPPTANTVYSPLMVVSPATSVAQLELLSPASGTNGFHHDFTGSAFIRVPTPLEQAHSSTNSDSTSPPHSPCTSPTNVSLCSTAADLAKLQKTGALGNVLSPDSKSVIGGPNVRQQSPNHRMQAPQNQMRQQQHHAFLQNQAHLSQQQPLELLGLNKTNSLTHLSTLAKSSSPTPLFNGLGHSHGCLANGNPSSGPPSPPDPHVTEKLAPGIERKNSTSSIFSSPMQFAFDYEQKKLLAMKAMQKKPEGESRIPTDIWAGMGFSKSMPESAIRDKLGQMGISARCFDNDISMGYEPDRPEIDLSIDQDLWSEDTCPDRSPALTSRPLNKAPGEYPSPRKKTVQYGLSHSNHVDSASLPPNKSVWTTKTDLAELFSALGLGKYTDLFQQQEIDLATFLTLSDHDLKELGISTFGARRKMLLAIADLNKRRTLMPSSSRSVVSSLTRKDNSSPTMNPGLAASPNNSIVNQNTPHELTSGGNSASELFPSPNPPSALMTARGGPSLGSLSGHW